MAQLSPQTQQDASRKPEGQEALRELNDTFAKLKNLAASIDFFTLKHKIESADKIEVCRRQLIAARNEADYHNAISCIQGLLPKKEASKEPYQRSDVFQMTVHDALRAAYKYKLSRPKELLDFVAREAKESIKKTTGN